MISSGERFSASEDSVLVSIVDANETGIVFFIALDEMLLGATLKAAVAPNPANSVNTENLMFVFV